MGSPTRILLVEQNEEVKNRLRRWLCADGLGPCLFNYAHTLEAALRRLAHGGVDLVLVDTALPDSRGVRALLRLRAAGPGVPMVALIGLDEIGVVERLAERGLQDYLIKDYLDGPTLVGAVRYAVDTSRLAAERRPEAEPGWSWLEEHADCRHGPEERLRPAEPPPAA